MMCVKLCKHSANQQGGWEGRQPPHDVRTSDDSTKAGDDDDLAKGAVISVNILNISGGAGGGRQPPP